MSRDTCPKNLADTAAWTGFANANSRSKVTIVGPSPDEDAAFLEGSKEFGNAGWNLQIVLSVLSNVVDDEATACFRQCIGQEKGRVTCLN